MTDSKILQPHNQILFNQHEELGPVRLGPYSSYTWRHDPRHLFFTLARYKFCAKLLHGCNAVLEVGCGDSVGAPLLLQTIKSLHCVDIEPAVIAENKRCNTFGNRLTYEVLDITILAPSGNFDGAVSLDVIEHIDPVREDGFLFNFVSPLSQHATCIIGTPNVNSQQYASENSRAGHINLKDAASLRSSLEKYFHKVFIFSMNDEVVHTGFYPMAHYLIALATSRR
ncbi:Methyltransferase domain-containing protein [Desulfonatronum zhilinae]|nr:Methyltransferase domain-containing protein [Desulfonatronum zhilinae]